MKNKKAYYSHSIEVVIPFYDLDPMFIVWHGNYLKYFERAREGLLSALGFGYQRISQTDFTFPIVDLRIKYVKPAQFEETVVVTAYLIEYENRLRINYVIKEKRSGAKLTEGYTIQVAINCQTQELYFVSPEDFLTQIEAVIHE